METQKLLKKTDQKQESERLWKIFRQKQQELSDEIKKERKGESQ
jgi:hypothetical protein